MDKNTVSEKIIATAAPGKFVVIRVYYSLGGYNYFTHREESRGYYISVSPEEREQRGGVVMRSYTAFTGRKLCVHCVKRKSAKAEKEALEKAAQVEKQLIDFVCEANGLAIAE